MNSVIELKDVWKKYPMTRERLGFKEFVLNIAKLRAKETNSCFWAAKGISLQVQKGECLGIIGKNGAGKSTLLSLMLGTVHPTKGEIKVHEKRTPLLELGSGFHPDLNGRENILINGVLLGLTTNEVLDRMDDIVAFSEIGQFMNMPVRTYSSGMYLRLAFSVAIHIDPKLLLIDEILAVGDESFQKKSRDALAKLMDGGVTTILVSHSLNEVKEICNRVIWVDGGEIKAEGDAGKVVDEYLAHGC